MDDATGHNLDRAFRATTYRLLTSPPIDLRIGEHSPAGDALLRSLDVEFGVYFTSDNPRAAIRDEAANAAVRESYPLTWMRREYRTIDGESIADDGDWPIERGWLVARCPEIIGVDLGRRYGQFAVLWIVIGEPVAMRWCLP